jgi:hypothetical protein
LDGLPRAVDGRPVSAEVTFQKVKSGRHPEPRFEHTGKGCQDKLSAVMLDQGAFVLESILLSIYGLFACSCIDGLKLEQAL